MNQKKLFEIASHFALEGEIASIEALGEGFINDTFVVTTAGAAPNYILQRKSHAAVPRGSLRERVGVRLGLPQHLPQLQGSLW